MQKHFPRFWIATFILGVIITVHSLRTWRLIPEVKNTIPHGKNALSNIRRAHFTSHSGHVNVGLHSFGNEGRVDNSTLGFQKIFAINLPSRPDKHDSLLLASKITGFDVEFIDGVDPKSLMSQALPQKYTGSRLPPGVIGCWRAHMNVLANIVQDNLSTALVLEDDADWDIRLLRQLQEFSIMSHAVQDPMYSKSTHIRFETLDPSLPAVSSPYGSGWDILFLGNCGVDFDKSKPHVVRARDETVPDLNWLNIYGDPNGARLNPYPGRARLVGYAVEQTCTYAYAVTQFAARRLLLDLGLERLDKPIDLMIREWCEGKYPEQGPPRRCIGILPSLFESHRKEGSGEADSDIDGDRDRIGYRQRAVTPNIRKSVRMNLGKLLDGATLDEIEDQFPNFRFGQAERYPARIVT